MPRTLLLADDSVVIQKLVGLSFANEDVELITVDNGDDAIDRARASRPDLILADVVMPGKSGYDVCQAIKSSPELAHTPVLLLTGTFEAFDEERAAQVGSDGHITKPFEAQALVERVKAVLAQVATPAAASEQAPDLAIGGGDSFDFFDEQPEDVSGDLTPAIGVDGDPIGELTLEPGDRVPAAASAAPAPMPANRDPGATMLVDELFDDDGDFSDPLPQSVAHAEASASSDPDSSIPDVAPPSTGEASFSPESLADIDLFGDEPSPADEQPETLDTGNDSGPIDLDLEMGFGTSLDDAIRAENSDTTQPDATVAVFPEPALRSQLEDSRSLLDEPVARATGGIQDDRFDISSSDLDDAMTMRAAGPPPAPAPWPSPSPSPSPSGTAPAPPTVAPAEVVANDDEPIAIVQPIDDPFDAPAEAQRAPEAVPVSPEPQMAALAHTPAAAPVAATTAPTDVTITAPGAPIDDAMRQHIREALEKIAWEAFSDVSQTIVRQTLEQVERIAWEVIPQMAERLIQEEIRRLKNDD